MCLAFKVPNPDDLLLGFAIAGDADHCPISAVCWSRSGDEASQAEDASGNDEQTRWKRRGVVVLRNARGMEARNQIRGRRGSPHIPYTDSIWHLSRSTSCSWSGSSVVTRLLERSLGSDSRSASHTVAYSRAVHTQAEGQMVSITCNHLILTATPHAQSLASPWSFACSWSLEV